MQKIKSTPNYKPFFFPFPAPLEKGIITRRYKRFLADIELEDGRLITAHVANSGSMLTCWEPGAEVVIAKLEDDGKRKLQFALQAVKMPDGWVCVNTMLPNKAVAGAVTAGTLSCLAGYDFITTEIKTTTGSRFDLALLSNDHLKKPLNEILLNPKRLTKISVASEKSQAKPALIEIKNATLRQQNGVAFPDAVTERGQKHLNHLIDMKKLGYRAIICFFAARNNTSWVKAASEIDPAYAKFLQQAVNEGVEAIAIKVNVTLNGLFIEGELPVIT